MSEMFVFKGSPSGRVIKQARPITDHSLKDEQVLVRITHSGICGTDEHYKTEDMVLGHEGVGVVEAIGESVKRLSIGDRVGWGYCHGSCMACRECQKGQELYCSRRELYGATNLDQGSFASHAIWNEAFLFLIPDSLSSAEAAPLMCAGAAVYSALSGAKIRWSDRVGILGVGGLGHLAIQFAAKMGCQVVAVSNTPNKEKDATAFGATEFVCLADADAALATPVDCLLLAGAKQPDWSKIIPLVRRGGLIVAMTVDPEDLRVPYMELVMNAISIQGSLPAPPALHREMLEFASLHSVLPMIETFPFTKDGIDEAMEKLRQGRMRYRAVVVSAL
ncbi:putative formaldehyde dehydrogenase AdhA [Beauveria bassiana]|uniref:Putative formaldehyde dehydrogenase AdhA n=1 Tax=Beauveria bassiana TaxID=176275 RepID=A0A2N6NDA9_BEABA|nr:putative formaldehyde dehydrogenase AdhA [Beauveria bassiana]